MSIDVTSLMNQITALIADWGLNVIGAIVVLLLGRLAAGWARGLTRSGLRRANVDATLIPLASGAAFALVMLFVGIAVLGIFGVPTASFVAVLGALGLAIGLAFQGTFSNFASGIMLLLFRPISAGDLVEVGGSTGVVDEISLFTTVLNTPDNVRIYVPNSEIFGETIKNYSANDKRRVDLVVGVGYDDDLALAVQTIQAVIADEPRVLAEPQPVVAVSELGDSSVNFVVRPWCSPADYWEVRWALTRAMKERLEGAGCNIPYPQRDVHIHQELKAV